MSVLLWTATARYRDLIAYFMAATLGALAFFVAFPAYILDPTNLEWIFPRISKVYNAGDFHSHYLGWRFLRSAPISFPLGAISDFVAPLGTHLAYTDSIPILAFPLRMISHLLPDDFQYLGFWVLLSFILQSVFAYRVLRRCVKDPFCLAIGTAFVTFSPVLIWRWNHVALMSHWLLLWSFDVLLENLLDPKGEKQVSIPILRPILIMSLATLIHPYIAVMVAGICWALPLGRFIDETRKRGAISKHSVMRLIAATAAYVIPMGFVLYVFGFLKSSSGADGFHYFGTDFLSLFDNQGASSFIPRFKQKKGLYEGFAWPGLGGWLLLGSMLLPRVRSTVRTWINEPYFKALLVTCGLMWFFALSENIHVASFWLIDLEWFWRPFKFFTAALRTSGRYIWPLYYLLLLSGIVVAATLYPKRVARMIFIGALLLQFVDIGHWVSNRAIRYPLIQRNKLTSSFWSTDAKRYSHIKMIPPSQDAGYCLEQPGNFYYEWVELAEFAAKTGKTINSGYMARYDRFPSLLYCGAQWYEFIVGPLQSDSLYVLRQGYVDKLPATGTDRNCNEIDGYMVCVARD